MASQSGISVSEGLAATFVEAATSKSALRLILVHIENGAAISLSH
jgi:hypothetical protein